MALVTVLSLNALRGVDHEHRAFARRKASAHLIGEVDVAGGVDKIELVLLAIVGGIGDAHGLAFDGDATLALDIHGIEQLLFHVALGTVPVSSRMRSESVDLPWSIWAMMLKLRSPTDPWNPADCVGRPTHSSSWHILKLHLV